MILGLPVLTLVLFIAPVAVGALFLIPSATGNYEGKKIEEEYDVDEWYYTF